MSGEGDHAETHLDLLLTSWKEITMGYKLMAIYHK